jgi:pimeloyl-ACP methyl ester carboxylesterase
MVFVPGFGDTPLSWASVWIPLRPILSREVDELIWVDFPGFGGFLHEEPAFDSMDELERCFAETIGSLKPKILAAHSLGGWLSSSFVTNLPPEAQPEKLILIDPSGIIGKPEEYPQWRERFEKIFTEGKHHLRPHVFSSEPFWMRFVEEEFFYFLETPEIQSFVRSMEPRHLVESRLDKVRSKTWVIWGELDTLIPAYLADEWLKRLTHPDSDPKLILFSKSGHSPQLEATGRTIAVMTQILLGKAPIEKLKLPFWKVKTRS